MLPRSTTRILVVVMAIVGLMRHQIRGYVSIPSTRTTISAWVDHTARRCPTLLQNTNVICSESKSVPTLVNPISKRRIHLGGPKYRELMKDGGWVQHEGTLQRIDMNMLGRYQQDPSIDIEATTTNAIPDANTDDTWYSISPLVLVGAGEPPSVEDIASDSTRSPMDETTREEFQREILFASKPSHLHCVPSRSLSDSLSAQVQLLYPGSKPCHRLDRDTSGIVVFGLTKEAHRDVSMQFEARTTSKSYVALVAGRPEKDSGIVDLPIGKMKTKEGFNRWTIGGEKPRDSVTHWEIDKVFDDVETGAVVTRMKLLPVTGRGHQLRLHMKAIGCPILGDTIHGDGAVAVCSPRLCLHAQNLRIDWNGLRLEAESIPPF